MRRQIGWQNLMSDTHNRRASKQYREQMTENSTKNNKTKLLHKCKRSSSWE